MIQSPFQGPAAVMVEAVAVAAEAVAVAITRIICASRGRIARSGPDTSVCEVAESKPLRGVFDEKNLITWGLFFLLASSNLVHAETTVSGSLNMAERYQKLLDVEDATFSGYLSTTQRAKKISLAYHDLFFDDIGELVIKSSSDDDLLLLFKITNRVAAYDGKTRYAEIARIVIDEMMLRKIASRETLSEMVATYNGVSQFSRAIEFSRQFGAVSKTELPTAVHDKYQGKRSLWNFDPVHNSMSKEPFVFQSKSLVVMTGAPECHFSSAAMKYIATHHRHELMKNFLVMVSQSGTFDFGKLKRWKHEYSGTDIRIVDRQDEWVEMQSWSLPSFYFFKHGKLLYAFVGWPLEGNRVLFHEGLRRIGLGDVE